ncbi:MAG: HAMP domain-containing sensor histidine kinase [Pseudomonadota bacterium]
MKTLFAKISLALLVIVAAMGAAFFFVDRVNTNAYYDELSQKLNAPIAMYVTDQRQLINDGVADLDSLRDLASHAMVINPTAEIYLLDTEGQILGHNQEPESILHDAVDLGPIQTLIDGEARFPLYGDDPRNATSKKVFSAWPVASEAGTEGYLYVVLGGQKYEELANNISDSYVARSSVLAIGAIVLLGILVALLVVGLLTRRLKDLDQDVRRVTESRFELPPNVTGRAEGGDELDALAGAFNDMSKQIRRQIDQLTENDRLRRELVSNISHDLRTPLAAMQGYIDTLLIKGSAMSEADRSRYLHIAQKHTVRLGALIGDLFELSKLDSATVTPVLESFSIAELVQDIAHEFQIESEKKNIDLQIQVDNPAATTVGDIGLIQRVLENLVRNAIQFTPNGGDITISIAGKPESVAVAVSDNGPGIAPEDVPRIFDRFYRARDGEEARSDSSGLGLAIVKRILDLHDSRIEVIARRHGGTRFEFELPLVREAA